MFLVIALSVFLMPNSGHTEKLVSLSSKKINESSKVDLLPTQEITLKTAISRALQSSPRLKSAARSVRAAESVYSESGRWANPEIGIQAENITGNGRYKNFKSAEITYGISQTLEIGGKRSKRKAITEQDVALSRHEQMTTHLSVIHEAKVAHIHAVAAQEMHKLAQEQKETASHLFQEVNERVEVGRESIIQRNKAEIILSTAQLALELAQTELEYTKHTLSHLWGDDDLHFSLDNSIFFRLSPPIKKTIAKLKMLQNNPKYRCTDSNLIKKKAIQSLERSKMIPDPNLNLGVRELRETRNRAFIVGLSIPIPIFKTNRGNIERARQEVHKARSDQRAIYHDLSNSLEKALKSQMNSYHNASTLKKTILLSAGKTFTLARQGYSAGKFSYLEVLDAQRTLFDLKKQYIMALKNYQTAKAMVEKITADCIEDKSDSK